MTDQSKTANPDHQGQNPRRHWWFRFIGYVKRKAQERKSKRHNKQTGEWTARHIVAATWVIAGFTAVLAFVSYFQWKELQSSGVQTDRLLCLYSKQLEQFTKQAGDTHDLAVAAGKQADRTKTVAEQAIVQAKAASSAAETAKEALHVSERAYLGIEVPTLDETTKAILMPLQNTGRLPTGIVEMTLHEATFKISAENAEIAASNLEEYHWSKGTFQSIEPNSARFRIKENLPAVSFQDLRAGSQSVVVAGEISYNDGFPNTSRQSFTYCMHTYFLYDVKTFDMVSCDPKAFLPMLKKMGGYPAHEQKKYK